MGGIRWGNRNGLNLNFCYGIIFDLHIVDGMLYNIPQQPDSLYKYSAGNYALIFKKYHTDSVQFKKSFKYYTANPEQLQAIYDDVLKLLQAKYDSVNKIKVKPVTVTPPKPNAVPA